MSPMDRYDSLLMFFCEKFNLNMELFKRQLIRESALNPRAISPKGAMGLAQFMPATFKQLNPTGNAFNPEDAILTAARYLRCMLNTFEGDLAKALAAYNWGIGHVEQCIKLHGDQWRGYLPRETADYVQHILMD